MYCIIISGNGYAHAVVVILFYFFKNYFHHYLRLGNCFFREIKFQEKNHHLLIIQTISIDGSIWLLNLDDNLNFFLKILCLERSFSNLFPPPAFEF